MKLAEWIEIEDGFLTNRPLHAPMPRGQAWEYYLWATRCRSFRAQIRGKVRRWVTRRKYLHTISAPTQHEANQALRRLMRRKDVKLLKAVEGA